MTREEAIKRIDSLSDHSKGWLHTACAQMADAGEYCNDVVAHAECEAAGLTETDSEGHMEVGGAVMGIVYSDGYLATYSDFPAPITEPTQKSLADVAIEVLSEGDYECVWYGNPHLCEDIYERWGGIGSPSVNRISAVMSALAQSPKWALAGHVRHRGRYHPVRELAAAT